MNNQEFKKMSEEILKLPVDVNLNQIINIMATSVTNIEFLAALIPAELKPFLLESIITSIAKAMNNIDKKEKEEKEKI